MDAKSLKKLNRRELLEVMVKISEENESLSQDNEIMKAELANRKLSAKEVGSLAQASLEANNFFVAADNAAKLYLENILRIEQETKERSSYLMEETLEECIRMRAAAGYSPEELIPQSWMVVPQVAPVEQTAAATSGEAMPSIADAADATAVTAVVEIAEGTPKKKRRLFGRKK